MMVSVASNARDRRRAGAGDHQPAVRAGVRADAGGGRVVRRAHEPKAGKSRRHSRLVASLLEPGEPETDRDRSPMNVAEPGLSQSLIDDRAHSRDRGGEIDMNVRRCAVRLGKRFPSASRSRARQRVAPPSTPRKSGALVTPLRPPPIGRASPRRRREARPRLRLA